ncbi:MAG: glycogen/starch synthase, partial [Actinomycetota bacterium]
MKVLLLSWEYPPRIIGGLGTHVHQLAVNLARLGLNVHVITKDVEDAQGAEESLAARGVHRKP